jgi:hypothetical protein
LTYEHTLRLNDSLWKDHSMSADGTYGFVYSGNTGLGIGVFTVRDNVLKGADWGGGRYSGAIKARPNAEGYRFIFDLFVPAGMFLVQGVAPQEVDHTRADIIIELPMTLATASLSSEAKSLL